MDSAALWKKYQNYLFVDRGLGLALDVSRVTFDETFLSQMEPRMKLGYTAMSALEKGGIANPDEKRMVGHYWLRNPSLAPTSEIKAEIEKNTLAMKSFASDVHSGKIAPTSGGKFKHILLIGIGGSALGPMFVNQSLSSASDPMDIYFFDNTDADGMEKTLAEIPDLTKTLCIVISKSGGTKETRNGQLVAKGALHKAGVEFSKSFVAVTMEGSELDKTAVGEKWLKRFPMWDWIGGRTSELSAVGMVAAALQGFDIDAILAGAKSMDDVTRSSETLKNPAALLALMWFQVGGGKGQKDMVVLPYKDRLELFSRYLQQLMMESLGKELDLDGKKVNQGVAVYGNKGSTDQHAYVQQLREGLNNFFVIFIEVLKERAVLKNPVVPAFDAKDLEVEPGVYCGDYLSGFFLGTRTALFEKQRESITITIDEVNAKSVGMLIALFERAVGLYASLININAYHQPGVEAGKKAAGDVLKLQAKLLDYLKANKKLSTVSEIATALHEEPQVEVLYKILWRLGANNRVAIEHGATPFESRYGIAA